MRNGGHVTLRDDLGLLRSRPASPLALAGEDFEPAGGLRHSDHANDRHLSKPRPSRRRRLNDQPRREQVPSSDAYQKSAQISQGQERGSDRGNDCRAVAQATGIHIAYVRGLAA